MTKWWAMRSICQQIRYSNQIFVTAQILRIFYNFLLSISWLICFFSSKFFTVKIFIEKTAGSVLARVFKLRKMFILDCLHSLSDSFGYPLNKKPRLNLFLHNFCTVSCPFRFEIPIILLFPPSSFKKTVFWQILCTIFAQFFALAHCDPHHLLNKKLSDLQTCCTLLGTFRFKFHST